MQPHMIGLIAAAQGAVQAAAASGSSATRYSFAATRTRYLGGSTTSVAAYNFNQYFMGTPDYPITNPRFFFPSFWCPATGSTEVSMGAGTITFQGVSILIGGTWYTCDGAADAGCGTMDNTVPGWLSPPISGITIPANTVLRVKVAFAHPAGVTVPFGTPGLGENREGSATSLFSKLTTSANPGGTGSGTFMLPAFMVAQGGDGRLVSLILGDSGNGLGSNDATVTQNWTARSTFGYIDRGLDDNVSSKRMAFANFSVSGQRPVGTGGWSSQANWSKKIAAIQMVKDACGDWPFDQVINGHLDNAIPATDYPTLLAGMKTYFTLIKSLWNKPIIQIEGTQIIGASTDGFATTANQTPASGYVYPTGQKWLFHTDVSGGVEPPLSSSTLRSGGWIDDSFAIWRTEAADLSTNIDKLKVLPFTTTVAAAYVSGGTIYLADKPDVGANFVFQSDDNTWRSNIVQSVAAGSGANLGQWAVTFTQNNGSSATAAGRAVREVLRDSGTAGLHPSPKTHATVLTQPVIDWKIRRGWV